MKIRTRLLSVILAFTLMILAVLGLFMFLQQSNNELLAEKAILDGFSADLITVQLEANKVMSAVFAEQDKDTDESIKALFEQFELVKGLKHIPKLDENTAASYDATLKLMELLITAISRFTDSFKEILSSIKEAPELSYYAKLNDFLSSDISNLDKGPVLKYQISQMSESLVNMNEIMSISLQKLNNQNQAIDEKVKAIIAQSLGITIMVAIFVLAGGIGLIMLVANGMVKSILRIENHIQAMARGDLTSVMDDLGKDELGDVSRHLNKLNKGIKDVMVQLHESLGENRRTSSRLSDAVQESSSASHEIKTNTAIIDQQMRKMDDLSNHTMKSVQSMTQSVNSFDQRIGTQNQKVQESSLSIKAMIETMERVGVLVEEDSKSADGLVHEAQKGMETISRTFAKVSEISSSIDQIQEMVRIIANIASQTNLLAMNAAIEAAHAGDAGRGFAVVADEIRKLAELSSVNSKDIATRTKAIIRAISEANATQEVSDSTLKGIIAQIRELSSSIGEIFSNVQEMKAGSHQVLSSMNDLQTESQAVTAESALIKDEMNAVHGAVDDVGRISHETSSNLGEITQGLNLISSSIEGISQLSDAINSSGHRLEEASGFFILEEVQPD